MTHQDVASCIVAAAVRALERLLSSMCSLVALEMFSLAKLSLAVQAFLVAYAFRGHSESRVCGEPLEQSNRTWTIGRAEASGNQTQPSRRYCSTCTFGHIEVSNCPMGKNLEFVEQMVEGSPQRDSPSTRPRFCMPLFRGPVSTGRVCLCGRTDVYWLTKSPIAI